jgi:hypothetical protein
MRVQPITTSSLLIGNDGSALLLVCMCVGASRTVRTVQEHTFEASSYTATPVSIAS